MVKEERERFINELIESVRTEILHNAKKIPDNWSGHQLRVFVADYFNSQAFFGMMDLKRQEDYRNAALIEWWMPPSRR